MWRRHLDTGVASFLVGAGALMVYFLLTPRGPFRGPLEALDAALIGVWLVVFLPVGRWALTTRWRRTFFMVFSVFTLCCIALITALDGGSRSPLGILLVLPVLFAAAAYAPRDVAATAVLAVAGFLAVAASGPSTGAARTMIGALMLALAGMISVMASTNRLAHERARAKLDGRLRDMATRDGLSGCLTYRAFHEALEAESARARRYLHPFSVILADLDSFKAINDTFGHDVGDLVLSTVGTALRSGARGPDVVGRIGGDEFAVLLPETSSLRAEQVARRLQLQVRRAALPVNATVSFGTATWHGPGDDLEDVVRRADRALYAAKHSGRDRLAVWEELGAVVV